ncbi:hypothetical protein TIFTF001_034064 [Ficus carica]|uniref:Uncharacterized protein n=1 Tax=Ficus carica TaxID=3494 RepID=A0AA88DZS0_FICCA|nr:hypothetical protein TIFTF001_034064 [Ficus carica]
MFTNNNVHDKSKTKFKAGRPNHSMAARHVVLAERKLTTYVYAVGGTTCKVAAAAAAATEGDSAARVSGREGEGEIVVSGSHAKIGETFEYEQNFVDSVEDVLRKCGPDILDIPDEIGWMPHY